jgi:hypothetical protein
MIYYLVTVRQGNGFEVTDFEVFLFSNISDAEAHSIKLVELKRGSKYDIKILPIELNKALKDSGCFGEFISV